MRGEGPEPEELIAAGDDAADAATGRTRTALANGMVGLMKRYYGRGPTAAKAWVLDDIVFIVMEDGLTRNEETLLAAGKEELVRIYRLSFQEAMTSTATGMVEEILGRKVLTYHSQIVFDPPRSFEIFVLEPNG